MRENNSHRPSIEHSLHKAIPALMGHSHKGSHTRQMAYITKIACFGRREPRVLEVDEEGVKAGLSRDLDDLCVGRHFDAKGLADLTR